MSSQRILMFVAAALGAIGLLAGAAFTFYGSGADAFMPHAHCYLFNQKLMALHGGSDLLIGLAYVAISGTLTYLVFPSRRERLLKSPGLDPQSRVDLLMVRRNALMLHKHVNDLLDLARLESGRIETHYSHIDLAALVRFLVGAFDSMVSERHLAIEMEAP